MKFKTNARCQGCVAAISSALAPIVGADKISFDLDSADRVMSVDAPENLAGEIERLVATAGFKAERLL